MENILKPDDWELTLGQLKSQRVQTLLQLHVLNGSIHYYEDKLKAMGVDINAKKEANANQPNKAA